MKVSLLLGVPLASLIITPEFSMDPINVPKAFILQLVGVLSLAFLLGNFRQLILNPYKKAAIIGFVFLLFLFSTFFLSGAPKLQQVFGAGGRNTGLLTYIALVFLLLSAMLISKQDSIRVFVSAILAVGSLNIIYGLIQAAGQDPIKWSNPYSHVIGFLGNPNFSSSIIGLSCVVPTALILHNGISKWIKISLFAYELIALYVILKTQSIQGFVVFGLTSSLIILIAIYKSDKIKNYLVAIYAGLITVFGIIAVFGMVNIGPLSNYLYKISVRQRGYYWNAGIEMLKNNPLIGVGLDSFGDWYWAVRSAPAALNSLTANTNSAHNVYIDIAATGGFPLLAAYIAMNGLILFKGITNLRNSKKFDPYYSTIFVVWIGYQAQSFISINQIGLAVWGWLFGGLVIGYSTISDSTPTNLQPRKNKKGKNSDFVFIPEFLIVILGATIVIPPFIADHNFLSAVNSRSGETVLKATRQYPISINRNFTAAQLFQNSKMNDQAISLAEANIEINPRDFNSWRMIAILTPVDSTKHVNAVSQMRILNPRDKSIK